MSFQKNKYTVIKKAISEELANFVYKYFLNKRKVARFLFDEKYISPYTEYFGVWNDEQVPNTYSHYGDIAMETLLQEVKPIMEKQTKLAISFEIAFLKTEYLFFWNADFFNDIFTFQLHFKFYKIVYKIWFIFYCSTF